METLHQFVDMILHMDIHLNAAAASMGPWIYLLVFLIIFCETGLVITPFLPGDSFLFALGALCSVENASLNLPTLLVLLTIAAILGDAVNYTIGKYFGERAFSGKIPFLNQAHLIKTQSFYEKHGGKTIIIARFVPIIRTFAPFVAGIGKMSYPKFATFNVVGALLWVCIFIPAGYFFGNLPQVKSNFHVVIFGIIGVSILPILYEWLKARAEAKKHS